MKDPTSADITPPDVYQRRRDFLKNAGFFLATAGATAGGFLALSTPGKPRGARPVGAVQAGDAGPLPELTVARRGEYTVEETVTSYDSITTYNNYYELGTGKGDPAASGGKLRVRPWTVEVGGLVHRPQVVDVDELVARVPLEERVYRMRCVEAWSMVIPWLGFPLKALLDRVEPLGSARYVAFETLYDPEQLPGQHWPVLPWPYVEGLRLDEASHPLTLLAVGLYGQRLLPQNGAPLRLVVPWKYGFKGIKSIVRMTLVEDEPVTTWSRAAPSEYGFYANVNPQVAHPRWSQASERRLGELLRRPTLPFNGYAEQVAGLYSGMDLTRSF